MWDLPGPGAFIDDILDHLASGTTLVVALPDGFDVASLRRRVVSDYSGDRVIPVAATECVDRVPDPAWILDVLQIAGTRRGAGGIDDVVELDELDGAVLWIEDLEGLPSQSSAPQWRALAVDWARATRRSGRPDPPTLVLCARGAVGINLGCDEPGMATVYWWGRLHRIDVELYLHLEAPHRSPIHRAMAAEIAQFDPSLALTLAEQSWSDVDELAEILRDVGSRPIPEIALRDAEESVPTRHAVAWAQGAVDRYDDERRPVVHACCLLADPVALTRRQWRGQIRTVLPSLEVLRGRVVERALTAGYLTASMPDAELDFAGLAHHLSQVRTDGDRRRLTDFAHKLRLARNVLAHLNPMELAGYDDILESARRLGLA